MTVALTACCTMPWPHGGLPDPPVWSPVGHWELVEFCEAASSAAICSASWSKRARKVMLVCLISFTCLVNWEIKVA